MGTWGASLGTLSEQDESTMEQKNSPKYLKTTCLPHPKESKGGGLLSAY